jgi:hypothetical protein
MGSKRIPEWLLIVLALPAYQVWHIAKYANTHQSWPAKVATLVAFLPVLAFFTFIWASLWTAALWLAWHAVN